MRVRDAWRSNPHASHRSVSRLLARGERRESLREAFRGRLVAYRRGHGLGRSPTRASISIGAVPSERLSTFSSSGRRVDLREAEVERLGEPVELRIVQIGPVRAAELVLQRAPDVAEMAVVEHHDRRLEAVFARRRQFLHAPAEAAVAVDADHSAAGIAVRNAERGREAVAKRALIAGRDVGVRPVNRIGRARQVSDLRQLVDENAVVGNARRAARESSRRGRRRFEVARRPRRAACRDRARATAAAWSARRSALRDRGPHRPRC